MLGCNNPGKEAILKILRKEEKKKQIVVTNS